jgi:two-component system CheB/CheR fusion protein
MKKNFKKQPTKTTRAKPSRVSARNGRPCPIVGIGASSGGLEAFSQLLRQLPADTGFGFVLVQHLDPQHQSALAGILARTTTMPVRQVTNNLRVEANNVYIIPPNTSLGIEDGVLKLLPRQNNRLAPRSIDQFFESLAKDQAERAIGVILSGNATDGTLGLEAIKAGGGFTFAQDKSARYDSMPRSAAAAGCVDRVLSPAKIASELARIAKHPYLSPKPVKNGKRNAGPGNSSSAENPWLQAKPLETAKAERFESGESDSEVESEKIQEQRGYNEVLRLLRNHSGVDFSLYKSSTVSRRIARRSVLNRQPSLQAYASFLRGNTKELGALYSDALIGVTSFFRNPASFAALKQTVFPKLLAEGGHEPIRVWVLGCSTGQEAYSLAIAYIEAAEKYPRARKLQIFATDLNEANLEKARIGLYPKTLGQDVSSERLQRFFVEDENGYRVGKQLQGADRLCAPERDERPALLADGPDKLQEPHDLPGAEPPEEGDPHVPLRPEEGRLPVPRGLRVGGRLRRALRDASARRTRSLSARWPPPRAFQIPVKQGDSRERFTKDDAHSASSRDPCRRPARAAPEGQPQLGEFNAEREADRVTVNHFAPPGVLINADFQVLQFRGRTGAFLEAPTGKATFDLLRMAREGLMLPLRAAINSASRENSTVQEGRHQAEEQWSNEDCGHRGRSA